MDKSIYDIITESLVDGRLPEGFRLPPENKTDAIMAEGALDGTLVYHRAPGHQLSEEQTKLIFDTVESVSDGDFYGAEELLWRIAEEIGAWDAHQTLRRAIASRASELNLKNVVCFAATLATQSDRKTIVKISLSMLSVFNLGDEIKNYIRTLGLSDSLTLFAAMAMEPWGNANDEWFDLARKVRGWGRIHLVAHIQPTTEEIRRWLLREGVHNDILPAYSALDCWTKADVPAVLAGEMDRADFEGIRDIMDALLDEGPVEGISAVENGPIRMFLARAKDFSPDEETRGVIARIRDHFADCGEIAAACDRVLATS